MISQRLRSLFLLLALAASWPAIAQNAADQAPPPAVTNLIFNASFELGDAGFGCMKFLRPDTNPELRYDRPVIDATTAASGKQSMRIPNGFVEETMFYGREFPWEPGADYTFSAWMKSTVDAHPVHIWLCTATWAGAHGNFTVGTEWTRYSFTFTAPAGRNNNIAHLSVWLALKNMTNCPAADLWVDDIQLNPGKEATPFAHGHAIDMAVSAPKLIEKTGDTVEVDLQCDLINYTAEPYSGTLTLAVVDDYSKKEVAAPTRPVTITPGEPLRVSCPVAIARYGSYRVQPRLSGPASANCHEGYFAVIGHYQSRPIDLDQDFCVGINLAGGIGSDARVRYGWQTLGGDVREEYVKLLAKMGCRIIRDHDICAKAFGWHINEPEEGRFDFTWADRITDLYLKYGIHPLPVLHGIHRPSSQPHRMGFKMLEEIGERKPVFLDNNHQSNAFAGDLLLGPDPLWRRYVRTVAERYRGRISHYEIFNEPNLYISPADYMRFLKSASEELRRADPTCKVIGFCSTGDLAGAGKSADYLKPCFEQGGLDLADIVSFHPYDSRQLSSKNPADQMIDTYRALIREHGRDNPLWNTELYYLTDGKSDNPNIDDIPKRFLIDLGEGVRQSSCLPGYSPIFTTLLLEKSFAGVTRHAIESLPAPAYVINNALARHFESARPHAKLRWPLDTICYVYEGADGPLAAFWTYGTYTDLHVQLPAADGVALCDMFGNVLTPPDRIAPLSGEPYYLVASNNAKGEKITMAEFKQWLNGVQLGSENPIAADLRQLMATATTTTACLELRNCQNATVTGQVRVRADKGPFGPSTSFSIAPFALQVLQVPMVYTAEHGDNLLLAEITVGDQVLTKQATRRLPFVYDARPGMGEAVACHKRGKGWNLKRDLATTFQAGYDDQTLRLRIQVKDSAPSGPPNNRKSWEQDGLELFFDTRPDLLEGSLAEAERYHDKVGRIFVLPHEEPAKQLTFTPAGLPGLNTDAVRCHITQHDDGYDVELLIPRTSLDLTGPLAARCVGFELAVNDADGPELAPFQQTWNSWGNHFRNRLSFGIMRFVE